jgi:membrane protein required for colicin V production
VWLDVLLFAVFLAFALLGAWRGALESGLRLAAWISGYAAAVLAAALGGEALASALGTAPWLGMPLAGTLAFFATQALFAVAIAIARRRRAETERGAGDRILGAAFGAARGALLALLIGWLGLLGDALRSEGVLTALPPVEGSVGAQWSGLVVESGASAALGNEPGARAVAALAARPRETLVSMRSVIEHPRVVALQRDGDFWLAVEAGDVEAALARPSARALTGDATLRRELASLGLVERAAAEHPIAFERALAESLAEVSARLAELRNDPEVRALLEDPEVLGLVQRGDALGLLAHPRFQSVVRRASAS